MNLEGWHTWAAISWRDDGRYDDGLRVFFVIYLLVVLTFWIILIKIIVAVLLHEFVVAGQEDKLEQLQERSGPHAPMLRKWICMTQRAPNWAQESLHWWNRFSCRASDKKD